MVDVTASSRYQAQNTPQTQTGSIADFTNKAITGWEKQNQIVAGKKTADGKNELDIFKQFANEKDPAKAIADMKAAGMDESDAKGMLDAKENLRQSADANQRAADDSGKDFMKNMKPDQLKQYTELAGKANGDGASAEDKKALTAFENNYAKSDPAANQALANRRQAEADVKVTAAAVTTVEKEGKEIQETGKSGTRCATVGIVADPATGKPSSGEGSTPAMRGMTKEQAELREKIRNEAQAFDKTLSPDQQKVRDEGKELNKQRNEAIKAKDTAKKDELTKELEANQKTFEATLNGDHKTQYDQIKTDAKSFNESMRSGTPQMPAK